MIDNICLNVINLNFMFVSHLKHLLITFLLQLGLIRIYFAQRIFSSFYELINLFDLTVLV